VGLQTFFHSLLPKDERCFDLLERQAADANVAAKALATLGDGVTSAEVARRVQEHEHAGDLLVHEVEESLARTYITPIDREDIHALAIELDDIADLTNSAARACEMMGVERPTAAMTALLDVLVETTAEIATAVGKLRRRDYAGIFEAKARVRALEKKGDRLHRDAVSKLFLTGESDVKVLLRERIVLDDIETAVDHCEIVADMLSTLAVKHG
jgi:uncharacterized protein Yka (UPF0111/DUF47 family)